MQFVALFCVMMNMQSNCKLCTALSWVLLLFTMLPGLGGKGQPAGGGVASSTTLAQSGPRIRFDNPVYEFGKVAAGEVVRHEFRFANTGDEVLRIQGVTSSCGCTSTAGLRRILEPGQTGVVPVELATTNLDGNVLKKIWVASNAREQTNVILEIKGTVWQPVELIPSAAVFGVLGTRTIVTNQSVKIVNNLLEPITVETPTSNNPMFQARLTTVRPGKEFALDVTTVPPLSNGFNTAAITLKTSATNKPVLTVLARAMVQPFFVIPQQIFLFRNPNGSLAKLSVVIINNQEESLHLSKPRMNIDGVEIKLHELLAGKRFRIDLSFADEFQVPEGKKIIFALNTDHPDFPVLELPVLQAPVRTVAQ